MQPATGDVLLVVLHPGGVSLAGESLAVEALVVRVRDEVFANPARPVLVKPTDGVALQDTVRLIDRLAQAGVTGVSLTRDAGP